MRWIDTVLHLDLQPVAQLLDLLQDLFSLRSNRFGVEHVDAERIHHAHVAHVAIVSMHMHAEGSTAPLPLR